MSGDTNSRQVLILDDDADFRKLIVLYLKKMFTGLVPVEYDPVFRGVPGENFDWSEYDILLLDYDLCMTDVTGLDILQANHKKEGFPAAIMLTGAGNEEIAVRAIRAGVHEYIRKAKLDKQQLHKAILDAFDKHEAEYKLRQQTQVQNRAFNKTIFYQQLERSDGAPEKKRILLLVELDSHEAIEEGLGVILRDNIVRHIAKQSFEVFQAAACQPSITRFSDISAALLIDDPASERALSSRLETLCRHLEKRPYNFDYKSFDFTVSIGALPLSVAQGTPDQIILQVRQACEIANGTEGNSFHIAKTRLYKLATIEDAEAQSPEPETKSAAASPQLKLVVPHPPAAKGRVPASLDSSTARDVPHPPAAKERVPASLGRSTAGDTPHPPGAKEQASASLDRSAARNVPHPPGAKERVPASLDSSAARNVPHPPAAKGRVPANLGRSTAGDAPHPPGAKEQATARSDRSAAGDAPHPPGAKEQATARLDRSAAGDAPHPPGAKEQATARLDRSAAGDAPHPPGAKEQATARLDRSAVRNVPHPGKKEQATARLDRSATGDAPHPSEAKEQATARLDRSAAGNVPHPPEAKEQAIAQTPPAAKKTPSPRPAASETAAAARQQAIAQTPPAAKKTPSPRPAASETAAAAREQAIAQTPPAAKKTPSPRPAASENAAAARQKAIAQTPPAVKKTPSPRPAASETAAAAREQAIARTPPAVKKTPSPRPAASETAAAAKAEVKSALTALSIKQAFDEKRVLQTFQPIISLSENTDKVGKIYNLSLRLLDTDGKLIEAREVYAQTNAAFKKYIDRWMIREVIGQALNSRAHSFLLGLNFESLTDPTFFDWMRKLLTGIEKKKISKLIAFEILMPDFKAKEKQINALISYLSKHHGFLFCLSEFARHTQIKPLTRKAQYKLVRIPQKQVRQLAKVHDEEDEGSPLQDLQAAGVKIIVDDIGDANTLTEMISLGVDYALGDFIGGPTQELDDGGNMESLIV